MFAHTSYPRQTDKTMGRTTWIVTEAVTHFKQSSANSKCTTRHPIDKLLSRCPLLCSHTVILPDDWLAPLGYLARPYFNSDLSYPTPASAIWLSFFFFFFSVLGMSSHMPSMHSITELHPQPHGFSFLILKFDMAWLTYNANILSTEIFLQIQVSNWFLLTGERFKA